MRRWLARDAAAAAAGGTGRAGNAGVVKAAGGYLTGYPGGRTVGALADGAAEETGMRGGADAPAGREATRADCILRRCWRRRHLSSGGRAFKKVRMALSSMSSVNRALLRSMT